MPTKKEKKAKSPAAKAVDDWGGSASSSSSRKAKGGLGMGAKIGAGVVALLAAVMLFGGGGNPVKYLDVGDEAVLKKAFFGGEVWAMTCVSSSDAPLPEQVEAVAHRLSSEMSFGAVDCAAKMGSGRTLMQRWKLKKPMGKDEFTMFLSNGVQVTQIDARYLRSEYELVRELRLLALRRPVTAKNTETLREKCWGKPRCLLVLAGGTLEAPVEKALHAVAGHHSRGGKGRTGASADDASAVAFVAMDAAEHRLPFEGYDLGDAIKLRSFAAGDHRAVYFRNASGAPTITALAHKGPLTTEALGAFLRTVSLDSDAEPHAGLVDTGVHRDALGIYRRKKAKKPKKPKSDKPSKFSADAAAAEAAKKAKKPETAEELKAAFKEQREKEQAKRAKMDEGNSLFEEGDEDEGDEEEDDEEEEEEEEFLMTLPV